MIYTISLLVENHQGVLSRIAGLFSGRGYNLESITAGITTDPSVTRLTLVCNGDALIVDQIKKQLNKLIDIIKVDDLSEKSRIDREIALIKVAATPANRSELFQVADVFTAKVMDVGTDSIIIEITGSPDKINDLLALLKDYNILELVRSGLVSIERSKKNHH
jgi:acetolactate synthase I/III small subunit